MSDVVWREHFFESLEGKCLQLSALRYKVIWYSAKKYNFSIKDNQRNKRPARHFPYQILLKRCTTLIPRKHLKKPQKLGPKEWLSG